MTGPDPLTSARTLLGQDAAAAARLAEAVLRHGSSATATLLLASARRRCGDADGAIALLQPLAVRAPRAWGVHAELGLALAGRGDADAAISVLEGAVALNDAALLARHSLNDLRMLAGVADGSRPVLTRDAALMAMVADLLDGDPAARGRLSARYGLDANDIAAQCLVADAGMATGRHDAVAALLTPAVERTPAHAPARYRLAEALHHAERDIEALTAIDVVVDSCPKAIVARALRGAIRLRLGRAAEAVADFGAVVASMPDAAAGWLAHGHGLRIVGRPEDAVAAYRRALAIMPALGEAYGSIADLKTAAFDDQDLAAMTRLSERADLTPATRAQIGFALGKAWSDRGADARAFACYRSANAVRRIIEPHDADAHDAFVAAMIATGDTGFFAARAGWGNPDPAPIFIVGLPRSGSSLIEQILASHPAIEGLSELPEVTAIARGVSGYPAGLRSLTAQDVTVLGTRYLARAGARRQTGRPRFIDKFPGNVLHIPLIHLMLPDARIIDVRRDPRDCCVSLFVQNFAQGQAYSYDLGDLARHHASYVDLTRHYDRVLPGRVLRVDYERVVDDLEGQTRRLLDHVGLPFDPACLRFSDNDRAVRTASSEQVRQPLYRTSIGRWRRYEPWIGPLIAALDDAAATRP
ncbi:MAG TPA: sulfotransferase [Sphingomonas sp.]|jgi:tetratricopeptide (TPR) repeat protein|uniref:tetratricopeptide repeat-containing sulfotransferase family protein n=1 Tax=Sphingomonas sp. TaxID=28214 RepID=UPI002EDAA462